MSNQEKKVGQLPGQNWHGEERKRCFSNINPKNAPSSGKKGNTLTEVRKSNRGIRGGKVPTKATKTENWEGKKKKRFKQRGGGGKRTKKRAGEWKG